MGFNTPEKGKLAICEQERSRADRATRRLQKLLNSREVTIKRYGKDKYKRTLAIVRVGGVDVGEILIREGLAYRYQGGTRDHFNWCGGAVY